MSERNGEFGIFVDQPAGDTPEWIHPSQLEAERNAAEVAEVEQVELKPGNYGYVAPVDPDRITASKPFEFPVITDEVRSMTFEPHAAEAPATEEAEETVQVTQPVRPLALEAHDIGGHVFFLPRRS